MKLHTITALLAICATTATAQNLSKEITIQREIHPTLRAASRINALPTLLQPSVNFPRLTFSDMTSATEVQGMITTLEPAASDDAITISPYRGYADLGYFPTFNLGASAGYRFISKPDMTLGAWAQYDGNSYKAKYPEAEDKLTYKRHTITAGVDFTKIFRRAGRLDVSADYTFNSLSRPWLKMTTMDQDAKTGLATNGFNIGADWSARRREAGYFVSGKFSSFSFGDPDQEFAYDGMKGVSQREAQFKTGAAYLISESSAIAGNIGIDFTRFNQFNHFTTANKDGLVDGLFPAESGRTIGVISFDPSYRYKTDVFRAQIGVLLQYTSHSGKTFHVAPDVKLSVMPSSIFSAFVNFGGGEQINRLSTLFNECPYISPSVAYANSHVPFTVDAGFTLMPAHGLSIQLSGGYAVANDWLMLSMIDDIYAMTATDLRAWHASAKAEWKWGNLLTLSGQYTIAPGDYRHAYFLNRDRAKHVAEIKATATPIDRLEVEASFEMRACRSAYIHHDHSAWVPSAPEMSKYDLGNSNSLNIGARYAFTDNFSVFARGENILNRRADILPGIEQQGVKGLIGVAVKF